MQPSVIITAAVTDDRCAKYNRMHGTLRSISVSVCYTYINFSPLFCAASTFSLCHCIRFHWTLALYPSFDTMVVLFMSADNAQLVSFAAKIVVGLLGARISALISYVSTPKALIFHFFGDFTNLFALANDLRWLPSARKHRTRTSHVHFGSWITVIMAVALAAAVLVTDLLLFQLSARKNGYRFANTRDILHFTDTNFSVGNISYAFPKVLRSNETAKSVFGSNIYMTAENGQYMNYPQSQRLYYTVDGPEGIIAMNGNYSGTPRCTVAHSAIPANVLTGTSPVRIRCFFDGVTNGTNIIEETVNTIGLNGKTIVSFYETKEGANYLFVELIQRVYDHFQNKTGSIMLQEKVEYFKKEGYTVVNAMINGHSVNLTNTTVSPFDVIEQSIAQQKLKDENLIAVTTFLSCRTDLTFKFGKYPVYTKKYILWGTYLSTDFLDGEGLGNFYSYSYDTRQYLVKGKRLRDKIYGINTMEINNAPMSAQYSTDRTDEEVVLSTLNSTRPPIQIVETELIDIFPGLIAIAICGLFVVMSVLICVFKGRSAPKGATFDVGLEVFHKGLGNLNGLNAWYLPAKMELADNLVMTSGVSLLSNHFTTGLVSKGVSTALRPSSMSPMSDLSTQRLVEDTTQNLPKQPVSIISSVNNV